MNLDWLKSRTADFDRAIEADRFGHAPLLMGPPGIGKSWLADWLARRLLCLDVTDGEPCGQCRSCQLFESETHPDFFRLRIEQDKTAILIDQVRDLADRIVLTPSIGSRRVSLIHSADRMNANAANALLKTLEEPAAETWLILMADQPERLPATILSRCQRWTVPPPEPKLALEWLTAACPDVGDVDRALALRLADGAPQTAARWLNEGELAFALAVRDHLRALLEDDPTAADAILDQGQSNPQRIWRWLARWTQLWARSVLTADSSDVTSDVKLSNSAAVELLQQCWQQALEGARLAEKPVRHDWLLHRWLLQWHKLSRTRG